MKRKKGEDGGEFDVFGEDETNEYGEAAIEGEDSELYDDELEEEFDDEDADFDEDFDEDESFDEAEEDLDGLVDDEEYPRAGGGTGHRRRRPTRLILAAGRRSRRWLAR